MATINVKDIMQNLKDNSTADIGRLCDYSGHAYICDAISEIADNDTSIYYADIIKFISENVEAVNDAIAAFGWDGCGSDLYKAGQMAEYLSIEHALYDDLENAVKLWAADYIRYNYSEEISSEAWEEIANRCDSEIDNNNRLWDIEEIVKDVIDEGDDESEEG